MAPDKSINKTIIINATVSKVWAALTTPALIKQWISDSETNITSDWQVGSPIIFSGKWPGTGYDYKDYGIILELEKEHIFKYSYWGQVSGLPDIQENYMIIEFRLISNSNQTTLQLTQSNFITPEIFGHWNFYWTVTLNVIKQLAESNTTI